MSDDGRVAVTLGRAGLRFLHAASGEPFAVVEAEQGHGPLALTPDGRHACVATEAGGIAVYRGAPAARYEVRRKGPPFCRSVAVAADASRVAVALPERPAEVWDAGRGRRAATLVGSADAHSIAMTRDGEHVLTGGRGGSIGLHRTDSGERTGELTGHDGAVIALRLTADDRWAVSAAEDGVRLWSLESGRCVHHLGGLRAIENGLAWAPDGRWLAVATRELRIVLIHYDWEREVRSAAAWDDAVRPHLVSFLTAHTPVVDGGRLVRAGRPSFDAGAVESLHASLRAAGLGWVDRAGVEAELARMASSFELRPPARPWWKLW